MAELQHAKVGWAWSVAHAKYVRNNKLYVFMEISAFRLNVALHMQTHIGQIALLKQGLEITNTSANPNSMVCS